MKIEIDDFVIEIRNAQDTNYSELLVALMSNPAIGSFIDTISSIIERKAGIEIANNHINDQTIPAPPNFKPKQKRRTKKRKYNKKVSVNGGEPVETEII